MTFTKKSFSFKKLRDIFYTDTKIAVTPSARQPSFTLPPPPEEDTQLEKAFFRAIRLEDMESLKKIVSANPEIVTRAEQGTVTKLTGLLAAAHHNCPKVAAYLCQMNADIEAKDNTGHTALITAAGGHHAEIVDILLAHKADLTAESTLGDTPLLAAMKRFVRFQQLAQTHPDIVPKASYDTVRKLIAAGADPQRKNKRGESAFSIAEKINDKELYLALLGADQARRDNADIQSGKKPSIRVMRPLRLKH